MKLLSSVADPSRLHDRSDIVALLRVTGDAFDRRWVENVASTFGAEHAQAFQRFTADADAHVRPDTSGL
jgi:hypothetical protein